jgi:hypothetical protein
LAEFYGKSPDSIQFAPLGILHFYEDLLPAGAARALLSIALDKPLCSKPVVINDLISVELVLVDGSITQLDFTIGVYVATAGNYQTSFKIVDAAGSDVNLLRETHYLSVGTNALTFAVSYENFMEADGPYQVLSGLVLGPAGSASKGNLGSGGDYIRRQFKAVLEGDLNNDGVVNSTDRSILLQYRNTIASDPGDRRDLNSDGKIDLLDVRYIMRMESR